MVYRNGAMVDLGTGFGSGSFSWAKEINGTGHIVGVRAASQFGATRATLWLNGRILDLPGLGAKTARRMRSTTPVSWWGGRATGAVPPAR
jgi:uncharacterized membrane protein